jgi:hypothetical protein
MMIYDDWKATNPDDEFMGSPSVPDRQMFKSCSCCSVEYTQASFSNLKYVGRMQDAEDNVDLTLRNCSNCGSTIAVNSCDDLHSNDFLPIVKKT